jgi:hypothetical protein
VIAHVHAAVAIVLADDEPFLGKDFFPWVVLALGAAMIVGNVLAVVRPPKDAAGGRPPLGRAAVMIGIGVVAAGWGLASLLT